jgi:hypothetical protein
MADLNKPDPTEAVKEALTLAIANLKALLMQKFDDNEKAVTLARDEVKASAADLAKANEGALNKALSAAAEANTKLEQNFESRSFATNEKIDRLTERINIWTGRDNSIVENKSDRTTDKGHALALGSLLIALVAVVIAAFVALRGH